MSAVNYTDEDNWQQACADEFSKQLHRAEPGEEWRARVLEIMKRVLHGLADELQEEIVRPRVRGLNAELTHCLSDGDVEAGNFAIDKFELGLRLAVEELAHAGAESAAATESVKPESAAGSA
jgi:hypothetical protein